MSLFCVFLINSLFVIFQKSVYFKECVLYKSATVQICSLLNLTDDAQTWFGFFKSFEDYVDFFEFNDFVENISKTSKKEYMPINILTGKAFETDYPRRQTDVLKEIEDEKQLKAMLERVRNMVAKRTKKMEDLINEYKQTNDTKGEKHENILHE